ncbi:hypothetical protein Aduo_008726 [Ancylostoma duodenale]
MRNSVVGVLGRTTPGKTKIEKANWWWNDEVQSKIAQKKSMNKCWMRTRRTEMPAWPQSEKQKNLLLSPSPSATKNCTMH